MISKLTVGCPHPRPSLTKTVAARARNWLHLSRMRGDDRLVSIR